MEEGSCFPAVASFFLIFSECAQTQLCTKKRGTTCGVSSHGAGVGGRLREQHPSSPLSLKKSSLLLLGLVAISWNGEKSKELRIATFPIRQRKCTEMGGFWTQTWLPDTFTLMKFIVYKRVLVPLQDCLGIAIWCLIQMPCQVMSLKLHSSCLCHRVLLDQSCFMR